MAARNKGNDAKCPLAECKPFFVVLDENYRTVLAARSSLSQDDVRDIGVFIKDYLDFVNPVQHFEMAESLKLHAFAVHVVGFSGKYFTTSSCYGQQEVSQRLFPHALTRSRQRRKTLGTGAHCSNIHRLKLLK